MHRMPLASLIVKFDLPNQVDVLGVRRVDNGFVSLPTGTHHVAAGSQPVSAKRNRVKQPKAGEHTDYANLHPSAFLMMSKNHLTALGWDSAARVPPDLRAIP